MDISILIVAGGSGSRMGSDIPKQFMLFAGKPILLHTLENLHACAPDAAIGLVLPKTFIEQWSGICQKFGCRIPHQVFEVGAERQASVHYGLKGLEGNDKFVAIHDGVRPFVSGELFQRLLQQSHQHGNAIPVLPITDSLRERTGDHTSKAVDRDRFISVQTPQIFRRQELLEAYEQNGSGRFADDASLMESCGHAIHTVAGDAANIKITLPEDLLRAEGIAPGFYEKNG